MFVRQKLEKVNIAGVGISNINLKEMLEIFSSAISNNQKIRVCVTPVNCIVKANKDEFLKNIYNTADVVLCDGMPILWASHFINKPLAERITGLDVLPRFSEICSKKGYSSFYLGAKSGVGDSLKSKLISMFPELKVVGVYSPPIAEKFLEEENQKIISMINEAKPNILWVSLTAPKQDRWIYSHYDKIDANIIIGIGGAFEVAAGLLKRAPKWMQQSGLEWLYRFLQEPVRLFHRYFIEAPKFFPMVLKQKIKNN